MIEILLHTLLHTLLDTAKLLPFLFLTYLLMEYLEHRADGATERLLRGSGRVGPLVGSLLGAVPQCGFSAAASGLYAGRILTTGTLIAVYLSTSDEMLPIMISGGAPVGMILKILGIKIGIGMVVGFAIDGISTLLSRGKPHEVHTHIEDICEREKCNCGEHFARSAVKHTLRVAVFILAVCFALNLAVELIGEDTISSILLDRPVLGNILSTLVGLIPNCASSIILTELYLGGVLSMGAMMSGLLVNSGIALAILFRNNRPVSDSFRILLILVLIALTSGIVIDLI
ncbi:MAG: arsenic efflux protein [Clostridia bacterium]|nr:arsenic efflux protein [Clostridia bacterium]